MTTILERIGGYSILRQFTLSVTLIAFALAGHFALAQSFTVLHQFTGGNDGGAPATGMTLDRTMGFYGTTSTGGVHGVGTAFRFAPAGSTWQIDTLYSFDGLNNLRDGFEPYAGLTIGSDGLLYGTTHAGGQGNGCPQRYGCGTVFRIKPGAAITAWNEAVLHSFGNTGGSNPDHGNLAFDRAGNLYGTTRNGGAYGLGAVFEMTASRGIWTETVLYSFGGLDGSSPLSGVVFDQQGNLYGTTAAGGPNDAGTVYRLRPSGSGWIEDVLYSFTNGADGSTPAAGVIVDASGNLYGATQTGGTAGGGTVFELSKSNDGSWAMSTLSSLSGPALGGPNSSLVMDAAGDLYGTTSGDGSEHRGSMFELIWSNGVWNYRPLHDFTGGMDGGTPYSSLVLDALGNLYGTASTGGAYGQGVIFEINPDGRELGLRNIER